MPIYKTSADWKTGIDSIRNVRGALTEDGGGRGLNYEEYLRIMLFLQDQDARTFRAMDIMEMDIRRTAGNAGFRMDACIRSERFRIFLRAKQMIWILLKAGGDVRCPFCDRSSQNLLNRQHILSGHILIPVKAVSLFYLSADR